MSSVPFDCDGFALHLLTRSDEIGLMIHLYFGNSISAVNPLALTETPLLCHEAH